jgi:serine/threonine protein kinase/Tol biopolymer transport system component
MTLPAGGQLGPYQILSPVGAGGQGEVYRAKDTRLDRVVAIKVLASQRSADPELRQRFEREARAVSSLNHPHICTLHDVGSQDGVDYLVMEYLEGESLADRLKKGPLPLDESLRYGREIADGLDEAHRKGIVHRDLKPGNVMLTSRGAKLLDFGLAKLQATALAREISTLSAIPTEHKPLTDRGAILGTFQYMAPEQLEGKDVDARTDVFAFGALLYEMVTGRRAFEGKSQASLIAAILEHEPRPMTEVQPLAPLALDWLVRGCLEKKPDDRWQSMRDVGKNLARVTESAETPGAAVSPPRSRRALAALTGILALSTVGLALFNVLRHETENRESIRFTIDPPEGTSIALGPAAPQSALSPDGRHLAFATSNPEGKSALWVRPLDGLEARELKGTENADLPFWSPDGRHLGFFANGQLKKIDIAIGSPQVLWEPFVNTPGATWGPDGVILFGGPEGISRISAAGGEPSLVTRTDRSRGEKNHYFPQFLPDGRRFLFFVMSSGEETSGIHVGSLDSQDTRFLLGTELRAVYAEPGYLLFQREGTLFAQALDPFDLELRSEPVRIADSLASNSSSGRTTFSVSETGVLAYRTGAAGGNPLTQLTWFDREGNRVGTLGPPGYYGNLALSPDGKRVAVTLTEESEMEHVWIGELSSDVFSRFTFGESRDRSVLWSHDGTRLFFSSDRNGTVGLYKKLANGAGEAELLLDSAEEKGLDSSAPNGDLVFESESVKTGWDLWVLHEGESEPEPYLRTEFQEQEGKVSPDGHWLAYVSDESGRSEVFVSTLPSPIGKWQVSTDGGSAPRWRQDGKELFYIAPDNRIVAVAVTVGSTFARGTPRPLFVAPVGQGGPWEEFDVSADGTRFLVNALAEEEPGAPITVVVNWTAALER